MSTAAEARSAGLLDGARRTIAASRPRSPHAHVLAAEHGGHLFLPNGSRLFDIPPDPVALQLGPITIGWYGLCYAIGLAAAYVVLIRLARADRPGPWAVVDAGSSQVACGIAPTSVLRDLGLGGCPPDDSV